MKLHETPYFQNLLKDIPNGEIMDQLPDLVESFMAFLFPLKDKPTFHAAAMSRQGLEVKGLKTFIANAASLEEEFRHEVTLACEEMLKALNYGLYDGDTNSFLDTSDLLDGNIELPDKIFLRYHKYPPKKN